MELPFILRTKFLVPQRRPERLSRPHLLDWLERQCEKRLVLVSAPPGYGKTTLLAEFGAETRQALAWYQLDASDSDPVTFLSCLLTCLATPLGGPREYGSAARALLAGDAEPASLPPERILAVLINELADRLTGDCLLVLEDYHLVGNAAVHALVDTLVESAPPALHIVISTRSDPPLSLARFRARGWLAELRAAELRLSEPEVAEWLARSLPWLPAESVHLLGEKTEGWPAGLQMALSSISGKAPAAAQRFIAELSGSHRFIFGYLAEEVYQRQTPERQHFLTSTAILTQISAAACEALPGIAGAQTMLENLEQDNLFLSSLDEQRAWFRYHPLFRDFLLARLQRQEPERLRRLHQAAARYFEAQAEYEAALRHYQEARAVESAARLVEVVAADYVERGWVEVLHRHLNWLPEQCLRERPALWLHAGDALRRLGQAGAATARYEDALAAFTARGDAAAMCQAQTALAEIARSQGDYRRALHLARRALDTAAPDDHAGRARALMAQAKAEGFLSGMDRGRALAEAALEAARQAGEAISARARAGLLRSLGQICWWHGDPYAAVRYCQEALQCIPDGPSPIAAEALITMATPYLYWRDLDTALQCAERGLDMAQQLNLPELLPMAYATLGNVLTRLGEAARAEGCLRQAMDLSRGLGLETYAQVMAAGFLAYNLCGQGRVDEAWQLAEGALWPYAGTPETYETCVCRSVLADVAMETGQFELAERIFNELLETTQRRQFRIPLAMVYFGLAYLALARGQTQRGRELTAESLRLLEPTGALQLYLDQGARVRVVAQAHQAGGERSSFMQRAREGLARGGSAEGAAAEGGRGGTVAVRCLGSLRVQVDGEEVAQERWVSTKARDLLAFFVTFRHERVPVDRALEAVWADTAGRGKTAFHNALYRLRHALRQPGQTAKFVSVEGGEYWLDAARFRVDVDEFEAALAKARAARGGDAARWYAAAIELYQGDYLDNLYYDWLMPARRRLRDEYLSALRSLAGLLGAEGEHAQALARLQQVLRLDPLAEDVCAEAMRYCAQLGDRNSLARLYQDLSGALDHELGAQPLPATRQLYEGLLERMGGAG